MPGCGIGYDLALFATHGYDSYGLEVSESAVRKANEYLQNPGDGPLEGEYKLRDGNAGRGKSKCLLGDFFKDDWAEEAGGIGDGFDVIYDNTVSIVYVQRSLPEIARRCNADSVTDVHSSCARFIHPFVQRGPFA